LPASPRDRARARQIMAWIRSDLMSIREERATHTFFYKHPVQPLSPAKARKRGLGFSCRIVSWRHNKLELIKLALRRCFF